MTTIINESECTAVLHNVIIDAGGTQVYSEGFETNLGSWASGGSYQLDRVNAGASPHSGTWYARSWISGGAGPGAPGAVAAARTFTGLTVDRVYVAAIWLLTPAASKWHFGIDGAASGVPYTLNGALNTWEQRSFSFRATATSHTITLALGTGSVSSGNTFGWIDDMTLTEASLYGTLDVAPTHARVGLDDRRSPFISGELTIPLPAEHTLESIDPRDGIRVTIDATNEWIVPAGLDPQDRSFDLVITGRRVNAKTAEVTITFASDEALLLTQGNATASRDLTSYPISMTAAQTPLMLRTVINNVLALHGAALQAGAADKDVSPVTSTTNLVTNANFRTATTAWQFSGPNGALARQTGLSGGPVSGVTTYGRVTWTGNSGLGVGGLTTPSADALPVTEKQTYAVSSQVRSNVAKTVRQIFTWRDSTGTAIGASVFGNDVVLAANTWTRLVDVTPAAPIGAVKMSIGVVAATSNQWANTNTLDSLGWMLLKYDATKTNGVQPFNGYDGDFVADTYYTYAYVNGAGTASTRTPLVNRDPESLVRKPGELDWDFLAPLVTAAGLRLFCDEDRKWWLVDPATYTVAGSVSIEDGVNLVDGDDEISIEHVEWADGVVVPYAWIDNLGVAQTAYDAAGTGAVRLKPVSTIESPYPGPGAAAAILARAQGRGNEQTARVLIDLDASPGVAVSSDLPGLSNKEGVVSMVEFEWGTEQGTDEMTVRPRDLVDA